MKQPKSQAAKPTRSQLLFDHAYVGVSIGPGQAVPFHPSTPFVVGTAISKTNDTTFRLNENGVYRVSYALRTGHFSSWLGMFVLQIQVNGAGVGEGAYLWLPGAPLVDQVAFQATAGSTVQIVNKGNATLFPGLPIATATINIDEVQ
jgi:hypothetical protein